jgi:hypothetical protein
MRNLTLLTRSETPKISADLLRPEKWSNLSVSVEHERVYAVCLASADVSYAMAIYAFSVRFSLDRFYISRRRILSRMW